MTRRKGRPNKRQRAGSNSSNQSQSPNQPTKSARFDLLSPYPEANQEETFTMDNEKLSKLIADTVTQALGRPNPSQPVSNENNAGEGSSTGQAFGFGVPPPPSLFTAQQIHNSAKKQEKNRANHPNNSGTCTPVPDTAHHQLTTSIVNSLMPALTTAITTAIQAAMAGFLNSIEEKIEEKAKQSVNKITEKVQRQQLLLKYEKDALEQYSRRETLRIHGLIENEGETNEELTEKLLTLCRDTGVGDIAASDISVCHRIGAKRRNGRPVANRPVLCKFVSRNIKTKVLKNKKNLAGKEPYDRVYVNEDLTGLRARLFAFARKHANVEKATTSDGRILCFLKSQTERGYPVTIETVEDLFKLGENSVNYKDFGLDNFLLTS